MRAKAMLVAALLWLSGPALAQQVETTVACQEPAVTALAYGIHTTGCSFHSGDTDDEFVLSGDPGTIVRVVVAGTSGGVVPVLQVYFGASTPVPLVDPATGNAVAAPVAFSVPGGIAFAPTQTGDYILVLSEDGHNNVGDYEISIQCAAGACDSDGVLPPDPPPPTVQLDTVTADVISPAVDGDAFAFQAVAGSVLRLVVASGTVAAAAMIEVRGPDGVSLPPAQTSFATPGAVDVSPTLTGLQTLLVFESGYDQTTAYSFSVSCIVGPCDSDLDGFLDPDPIAVGYGATQPPEPERTAGLSTPFDIDAFSFAGAAGTTVRVAIQSVSGSSVGPTFEVRDPSGALVQAASSCPTPCLIDVALGTTGTHRIVVSDTGYDNAGRYQFTLTCQSGTCPVGLPALAPECSGGNVSGCRDNCRLIPDMSQGDVGGVGAAAPADGIGDTCQCGDVSGNGRVTSADATLMTRSLLVPPTATLARPDKCNVNAGNTCSTADAVITTRALLVPPTASILQACSAAFR